MFKIENPDEKRLVLREYNHRLNNDLQALLAFIKIQRRFEIDDDEIINFTCVSIASISSIQNLMYDSEDEHLISTYKFLEDFIKILNDQYIRFNIGFSTQIKQDFTLNPKRIFQLMFLLNEMINQSIAFSFDDDSESQISFTLEKIEDECLLTYSDNGSGIKERISGSDIRGVLFDQLLKQIDGTMVSSDDNSTISIKFGVNL